MCNFAKGVQGVSDLRLDSCVGRAVEVSGEPAPASSTISARVRACATELLNREHWVETLYYPARCLPRILGPVI